MAVLAQIPLFLTTYIIPYVFMLSLVVFIHEMGHFLVGRWCGVKIDAFSLGFGITPIDSARVGASRFCRSAAM